MATYTHQYAYCRTHGAPALAKYIAWREYLRECDPVKRAKWSTLYVQAANILESGVN